MPDAPFVSYAQNGEDVVLWRALGHIQGGVYVDVGGWEPDIDSVTRLFYDRGWRGIDVEPVPDLADKFRERRPRDEIVQVAITDQGGDEIVLHRFGSTGLSTLDPEFASRHDEAGFDQEDIIVTTQRLDDVLESSRIVNGPMHFLKIDVEGAEDQVLRSIDLTRWQPWVLVVEATEPNSNVSSHHRWESMVLDAGYTFTLFDGLSRFYVSPAHLELTADLSYPSCALDNFVLSSEVALKASLTAAEERVAHLREAEGLAHTETMQWRNLALRYWAESASTAQMGADETAEARSEVERARRQLDNARATLKDVRADRAKLRVHNRQQSRRLDRLRARVQIMSAEITRTQDQRAGSLGSRLRRMAKRATTR